LAQNEDRHQKRRGRGKGKYLSPPRERFAGATLGQTGKIRGRESCNPWKMFNEEGNEHLKKSGEKAMRKEIDRPVN